jgi:hypothetical protein
MNKLLTVLLTGMCVAGAQAGVGSSSGGNSASHDNPAAVAGNAAATSACSHGFLRKNKCVSNTHTSNTSKMGNRGGARTGPGPDEIASGGKPMSPKPLHGSAHDD